jgi:hypothetical protein
MRQTGVRRFGSNCERRRHHSYRRNIRVMIVNFAGGRAGQVPPGRPQRGPTRLRTRVIARARLSGAGSLTQSSSSRMRSRPDPCTDLAALRTHLCEK